MSIKKFIFNPPPRKVAIVGDPPADVDLAKLSRPGIEVDYLDRFEKAALNQLLEFDSIVVFQSASQPNHAAEFLRVHASHLLDYDRRIYVRVATPPPVFQNSEAGIIESIDPRPQMLIVRQINKYKLPVSGLFDQNSCPHLGEWFNKFGKSLSPLIFLFTDLSSRWDDVCRMIEANPAGKLPNQDLTISAFYTNGNKYTLPNSSKLLLKRAFSDCQSIHLRAMDDGLSGVKAFRVHAELSNSVRPWPYLYFVKIGAREKITAEYLNYRNSTMAYVPFHLGARLALKRCFLAARHGILVGDFVSDAESIRDAARNGRGVPVIANLFSKTLRAWHETSTIDPTKSIATLLPLLLPAKMSIKSSRKTYLKALGVDATLPAIRKKLLSLKRTSLRMGPCHGDLNATNVMVRGSNAILIDFEKVRDDLPSLFDAAALEAGLVVEGFLADKIEPAQLLESIRSLYSTSVVRMQETICHPTSLHPWFFACVHQIRINARNLEHQKGQYAAMLAIALVKKICNPDIPDTATQKLQHRAVAFALGVQIIEALMQEKDIVEDPAK